MEVEMRKHSRIKHFKAVVGCLVAACILTTLLFVTVQSGQADDFIIEENETVEVTDSNLEDSKELGGGEEGIIETGGEITLNEYVTGDIGQVNEPDRYVSAVEMTDGNNTMTNNGLISTAGGRAVGILSKYSNYANITNSGFISTEDGWAYGIYLHESNYATFTNSGFVSTEDSWAHGILLKYSNDITITNNDTIETNGYGAVAIFADNGKNATITNNGSISTEGVVSGGIYLFASDYSTITNNGLISTKGVGGIGIFTLGNEQINTINNGLILTEGESAYGIWSAGDHNSIISNSNSIKVTGKDAAGIFIQSTESDQINTINNSGLISATGEAEYAILGYEGIEYLNLFSGSDIIGDIDLGGGNDNATFFTGSQTNGDVDMDAGDDTFNYYLGSLIFGRIDLGADTDTANIYGPGTPQYSHTLTIENVESIRLHNVVGAVNGSVVVTLDPTGQSVKAPVLSSLCSGLHGIINRRLTHYKPELIKLAATRITSGMLKTPDQPQAWGQAFSSFRKRDSDDNLLFSYDHKYKGFTGGFERSYKRARVGLLGGFSHANVEAASDSFKTDSNSYFGGSYGQYDFGRIKLAASLIAGYEDHDNDRMVIDNLSGYETARADFGSIFLSPSVTVSADFTVAHRLLLRPSATVIYSAGWYDDYHEHGTTRSNIEIDSRTLQALNPQLQLSAVYTFSDWCEFEVSAGGTARYTDDGSIDGNLGGSDFRFSATNDDSVYAGQLGGYLSADVTDRLELYVNAQFTDATGGETQDFFMAGLKFKF